LSWVWADVPRTETSRPESGAAEAWSTSVLSTLNIVVLTPMPSASVSTATIVKPGYFRSWRKA
jgi:hypothetical protein